MAAAASSAACTDIFASRTSVTTATTTSAAWSPTPSEPTIADEVSDHIKKDNSSSSEDNLEMAGHPFAARVFTSWKEVTNAVQCAALKVNKQVSCTAGLSIGSGA